MSATNWADCPNCNKIAKEEEKNNAYGEVSEAQYLAMLAKKHAAKPSETLREDYEIFIDGNMVFHVEYFCSCDECGFKFSYTFNQNIKTARPVTAL